MEGVKRLSQNPDSDSAQWH